MRYTRSNGVVRLIHSSMRFTSKVLSSDLTPPSLSAISPRPGWRASLRLRLQSYPTFHSERSLPTRLCSRVGSTSSGATPLLPNFPTAIVNWLSYFTSFCSCGDRYLRYVQQIGASLFTYSERLLWQIPWDIRKPVFALRALRQCPQWRSVALSKRLVSSGCVKTPRVVRSRLCPALLPAFAILAL